MLPSGKGGGGGYFQMYILAEKGRSTVGPLQVVSDNLLPLLHIITYFQKKSKISKLKNYSGNHPKE